MAASIKKTRTVSQNTNDASCHFQIIISLELSPLKYLLWIISLDIYLDCDYLRSCTSSGCLLHWCKGSSISGHPFGRIYGNEKHEQTDGWTGRVQFMHSGMLATQRPYKCKHPCQRGNIYGFKHFNQLT